ncbi:MAG: DUF3565 domain-containing protein [Gammaproteobacteria bacterium]
MRRIIAFRTDEQRHWIAELECGHAQHVRHQPPWQVRHWITTAQGRAQRIGTLIKCGRCSAAGGNVHDPQASSE